MLLDERVFLGTKALLDDYVEIRPDDNVLVAYTVDAREPAAWVALSLRHRGYDPALLAMRPLRDVSIAQRLDQALAGRSEEGGRLVVITLERQTMSHWEVFESLIARFGRDRCMVLRVIGASDDFFTKALNLTPSEISARNAALLHRLADAKSIRVTTPAGTDLRIQLDSERYRWVSVRGMWQPGGITILPAGEIATYPARVDGVLVADGAFNANIITPLGARLAEHPATVEIENSEAVNLTCQNTELNELFQLCMDTPHGRHVGELGLGTNAGIDEFIDVNSHLNERRCGLHLGFGQHNQTLDRVAYVAELHLDLITDGGLVWVDDQPDPIDLLHVRPTTEAHPLNVSHEDITGDCCGMAYGELQTLACSATTAIA